MKYFHIIVAVSRENNGIGKDGQLCWKNKEDMDFFKNTTTKTEDINKKNVVIMGRHTFESLRENPLKNRENFVISQKKYKNILSFSNLDQCLEFVDEDPDVESIFVIGGERLYREAINNKLCKYVYLNKIDGTYECDTFFPELGNDFTLKSYNELSDKVVSYIYEKLK